MVFFLIINSLWAREFDIGYQDFKYLMNKYASAQPRNIPWAGSFWPYKEKGIADNFIYDPRKPNPSPAEKFDTFFGGNSSAEWERNNHSCDKVDSKFKEGCESWWGHCNAWAAAAIKEAEPTSVLLRKMGSQDVELTVADQKAFLTEMYMENNSLFTGSTNKSEKTGKWIFDADDEISRRKIKEETSNYDAFWDVNPRAFFLILTNYIGIREIGVVIDRFTGDEVWNQPIAGYKMLDIRMEDIRPEEEIAGVKVYPVLLRTNIFWANDNVEANSVSVPFDIHQASDKFKIDDFQHNDSYTGRSLAYFLYFDAPLKISEDGKTVESSGKIIGNGVWYHQTLEGRKYYKEFDHVHPDFIWLPTRATSASFKAYRNPFFTPDKVDALFKDFTCTVNLYTSTKIENSFTKISNSYARACSLAMQICVKYKTASQICRVND